MTTLLAADIGGTKSALAIFQLLGENDSPILFQKRYENANFAGIEEVTASFLKECGIRPSIGCFAVAGRINGKLARLTNLPWSIDCEFLEQRFDLHSSYLINDLTALASSLSTLKTEDLLMIQKGQIIQGGVKAVIAPGTGLGQGFVVEINESLFISGTEGGHTDFGPGDDEQLALLEWMRLKKSPVSYEMLIAGPGLMNLYDFYNQTGVCPESLWAKEKMVTFADRTPVIIEGAVTHPPCPLCQKVVELFLSILGSEAANLALKLYATGGIYLGGGILPRLKDNYNFSGFLHNFNNKSLMSELMQTVPVYMILQSDTALSGIRNYVCRELEIKVYP